MPQNKINKAAKERRSEQLEPHLEQYLELCKRIYESMEKDGSWPWRDSTLSKNLVESEDNQDVV